MQMCMMSCERYMQNFRMQRKRDIKQGTAFEYQCGRGVRLGLNYNDGRRKNFFCVAVNLLELSELQEAMKQIQQNDELSVLSVKEQCSYIVDILQKIADRRNIELKLIKK